MRRVAVTGIGIVSSIGNNCAEVLSSLQISKSGIEFSSENKEHGLRSQVVGSLDGSILGLQREDVVIALDLALEADADPFSGHVVNRPKHCLDRVSRDAHGPPTWSEQRLDRTIETRRNGGRR